jgi:uncharacterized membrane protein
VERHHEAGPGHRLERLVFFSDAVFAIAITLLIIELHPPHLHPGDPMVDQINALLALAPSIWGFTVSFWVIGAFWAGHHRVFSLAGRWDERLIPANLWLLMAIVAMPFFTAFMSVNAFARLPVVLYSAWLLLAALFNIALQHRVLSKPVIALDADPVLMATVQRRGLAVALGAASALVASALLPIPGLGMTLLLTMPLWRRLLEARDRRRLSGGSPPAAAGR